MKSIHLHIIALAALATAHAGPGHEHPEEPGAGGGMSGGPVVLSETERANLRLETAEAEVTELAPAVTIPAILVLPPERHARITAPFEGRVTELLARPGDHVGKDEPLLKVAPLALGSPAQVLKAPMDGVIFNLSAVVGTAFTPETTLMETGDYDEMLAQGIFYQSPELTRIRPGQKATLVLDVYPKTTFPAVVQRIAPARSEASPFFHIYALAKNPDGELHPNYRARMSIETGEPQVVVAVPRRAVLGSLGKQFVFVETEPGHYERRAVVTGVRSGDSIEIVEGVLPGDPVVTVGNYQLQYVVPDAAAALEQGHGHPH